MSINAEGGVEIHLQVVSGTDQATYESNSKVKKKVDCRGKEGSREVQEEQKRKVRLLKHKRRLKELGECVLGPVQE